MGGVLPRSTGGGLRGRGHFLWVLAQRSSYRGGAGFEPDRYQPPLPLPIGRRCRDAFGHRSTKAMRGGETVGWRWIIDWTRCAGSAFHGVPLNRWLLAELSSGWDGPHCPGHMLPRGRAERLSAVLRGTAYKLDSRAWGDGGNCSGRTMGAGSTSTNAASHWHCSFRQVVRVFSLRFCSTGRAGRGGGPRPSFLSRCWFPGPHLKAGALKLRILPGRDSHPTGEHWITWVAADTRGRPLKQPGRVGIPGLGTPSRRVSRRIGAAVLKLAGGRAVNLTYEP